MNASRRALSTAFVASFVVAATSLGCSAPAAPDLFPNGGDASTSTGQPICGSEANSNAACPGAAMPAYQLLDFQPKSPRFGQTYGLDVFKGKTTVVVLLAGWCPYCQSQAIQLDTMHKDLLANGRDVNFVVINKADAANANNQEALTSRCDFPILQDTEAVDAWRQHGGQKDDFYIYDSTGALGAYLPENGTVDTNLSGSAGRENLWNAILAVK